MNQHFDIPCDAFALKGNVLSVEPHGFGHINRTWKVTTDAGAAYLFQRVNTEIFPNMDGLMRNIRMVTEHVGRKITAEGGSVMRQTMNVVPALDGRDYVRTADGCYRVYVFIEDTTALQSPRSEEDMYETAKAFGGFQKQLADFPAEQLAEVIPNFHNTPKRLETLFRAAEEDTMGRAKEVRAELEFIRERQAFAACLEQGIASGSLPLRVAHNDTKLNNLLFDKTSMKPISVVDLDTVMPGTSLYDFGDGIRFGASTAAEDEKALEKVHCDMTLYAAFTRGWLEACGESMTEGEKRLLPMSPRVLTMECGARFLTDYLQGDVYFHTTRPGQNLDRCRTQLKLVREMEEHEEEMIRIARECVR